MAVIKTYRTYMFRDKDPAIDELRTIVQDSEKSYDEVSELSGVAASTLYQWFHGETRRPHNASLEAVGRALGYRREWVSMKGKGAVVPFRKKKKGPNPPLAVVH